MAWPCPEGGGEAEAWGSPRAPDSVTSLHTLQTNKTLTRVASEIPLVEGCSATFVLCSTALCLCWGWCWRGLLQALLKGETLATPIRVGRALGERSKEAAPGGPRRCVCLCVSSLIPILCLLLPSCLDHSQFCYPVALTLSCQLRRKGEHFQWESHARAAGATGGKPGCPCSHLLLSRSRHL